MDVQTKDLGKSQIEVTVSLGAEEFKPFIERGAEQVSREVKIEGFRPGKVPYDVLKNKIGEMTILEEAANLAINKTLGNAIKDNVKADVVGQPQISITKLAPGNPLEYKAVLAVIPEITLGDYKEAKVKRKPAEVSTEESERMLNELREMRVNEVLVERPAADGDKVIADIETFLDKVPVEGGQGKGTAIIIGKGYIVPGFGKKLIGAKKGDIREFSLPYPKDHHMKNLAGKMVEFKVKVNDVLSRNLPDLDDKFAESFGAKKIDELKESIAKSLKGQKDKEQEQSAEKAMLEKLIDKTKFGDIPEVLIKSESETMIHELKHAVEEQGGKFEDYLQSLGKTHVQLELDMMPDAVKRVKTTLLIREIAKAEKISVSGEEVDKQVEHLKKHYENDEKMRSNIDTPQYKAYVANVLNSRKVVDKLKEWNIE